MRLCHEFQELLSFYLDDCLEADEKAQLEEHLKNCPECRKELEELQETINMFATLDDELVPPASFRRELREKLEKEQKTVKVGLWARFLNFINKSPLSTWMPMAAAAVLLIIIAPFVIDGIGPITQSAKEEAKMDKVADNSGYKYSAKAPLIGKAEMDMARPEKSVEVREAAPQMEVQFTLEGESRSSALKEKSSPVEVERKIIKNGHLNLEVDDYKVTTSNINALVQEMQGYIVTENTHVYDPQRQLLRGNVVMRIPQQRFEEALNRLEQMGKANDRTVDAQDVTEEYVDVQSRLKAMRLKEERLLAILDKSGTLGDVLAVENELARTRAELESLEGRLRYLNNRTELSTINVSIREALTPVKQIKTTGFTGVLARTQEAFVRSINAIIIGAGNLIVYLGLYLPFVILVVLGLALLWILWRKFKKRK